ncbi:putative Proline--tRNA ligase [Candidatus Sulfopaludibacter sp. SbA4]|nr:putative Proline--tRNA ligase [Candidatus Sulfopaludibacter sp. SbA4]
MRRSNFFMPMRRDTIRTSNSGTAKSDAYFDQLGYVHKIGAGIYTHLPAGYRLFGKVKTTLNKHLAAAGAAEHQFPALQPTSIWKESGRFDKFGAIMFNFLDQHGKEVSLAPTHEVLAAITAKQYVKSYRDLPIRITQTQTKFRDEKRPRGGVMRTREFTMQDLYSFDAGVDAANVSYDLIVEAYQRTLTELRIPFRVKQQADMGSIGGLRSHEFHVLAESGEDVFTDSAGQARSSIEIAHTFSLGTAYSEPVHATYADREGTEQPIYMCSFGLGIERTAASYVESYLQPGRDLVWSRALAPFPIMILGAAHKEAWRAFDSLSNAGYDPIIDDREQISFSQQWKEALLMGSPVCIVFGKRFESDGQVELYTPRTKSSRFVDPDELMKTMTEVWREVEAVELIEMSFKLALLSPATRVAVVSITSPSDLESSYCAAVETGTDLLGNFAPKKRFNGAVRLKAGDYWIIPVLEQPGMKSTPGHARHGKVEYFLTPSLSEFTREHGLTR